MAEARTVNLNEWAKQVGVGRSMAYALARRGEIPGLIRLGSRYLVSRLVMDRMLDGDIPPRPKPTKG